jgi:hypothetical protein
LFTGGFNKWRLSSIHFLKLKGRMILMIKILNESINFLNKT